MSNLYAVSYIDWFDHDLKMATTKADSEIEALYHCATIFGVDMNDVHTTDVEEFKQKCFDMDCMMAAMEI